MPLSSLKKLTRKREREGERQQKTGSLFELQSVSCCACLASSCPWETPAFWMVMVIYIYIYIYILICAKGLSNQDRMSYCLFIPHRYYFTAHLFPTVTSPIILLESLCLNAGGEMFDSCTSSILEYAHTIGQEAEEVSSVRGKKATNHAAITMAKYKQYIHQHLFGLFFF